MFLSSFLLFLVNVARVSRFRLLRVYESFVPLILSTRGRSFSRSPTKIFSCCLDGTVQGPSIACGDEKEDRRASRLDFATAKETLRGEKLSNRNQNAGSTIDEADEGFLIFRRGKTVQRPAPDLDGEIR